MSKEAFFIHLIPRDGGEVIEQFPVYSMAKKHLDDLFSTKFKDMRIVKISKSLWYVRNDDEFWKICFLSRKVSNADFDALLEKVEPSYQYVRRVRNIQARYNIHRLEIIYRENNQLYEEASLYQNYAEGEDKVRQLLVDNFNALRAIRINDNLWLLVKPIEGINDDETYIRKQLWQLRIKLTPASIKAAPNAYYCVRTFTPDGETVSISYHSTHKSAVAQLRDTLAEKYSEHNIVCIDKDIYEIFTPRTGTYFLSPSTWSRRIIVYARAVRGRYTENLIPDRKLKFHKLSIINGQNDEDERVLITSIAEAKRYVEFLVDAVYPGHRLEKKRPGVWHIINPLHPWRDIVKVNFSKSFQRATNCTKPKQKYSFFVEVASNSLELLLKKEFESLDAAKSYRESLIEDRYIHERIVEKLPDLYFVAQPKHRNATDRYILKKGLWHHRIRLYCLTKTSSDAKLTLQHIYSLCVILPDFSIEYSCLFLNEYQVNNYAAELLSNSFSNKEIIRQNSTTWLIYDNNSGDSEAHPLERKVVIFTPRKYEAWQCELLQHQSENGSSDSV